MIINRLAGRWQSFIIGTVGLIGALVTGGNEAVFAQVIPDDTLGAESSVVNPDAIIREILSDRIDGGATRGANLFHSFIEFNVAEGRGVYFTNPDGIENILSRVTGDNVSTILGRLGVLGEANLFLLNPNGILFGENASLDIEGSFVATTASGIELGEDGVFSATQPRSSRLLSVSPGALFYNAVEAAGGKITNRGNLTTGRNLTLDGENLDLQGQLRSGRDLTLQAQDTVTIRDSQTNPFIATAGGNLLLTGNQGIDIFALNHPDSGLFSGGDMVLRSAADVGGDAHYWSGGSFRIEQLDGSLGNLYSPDDPVIRASGDVSFDSYQGASLHILAGGTVRITGDVEITGTDTSENSIQETVTLSDGTPIEIDGSKQPTLDIRAGTTAVGTVGVTGETAGFSPMVPGTGGMGTRGDIRIDGNVTNPGGVVFLTNQYQSNLAGDIRVSRIDTMNRSGDGGAITIDSRGDIFSTELLSASGAFVKEFFEGVGLIVPEFNFNQNAANGGAIILMAQGNIVSQDIVSGSYSGGGDTGDGGEIRLSAGNDITFGDDSQVSSESYSIDGNTGDGGDISFSGGDISFGDDSLVLSDSFSFFDGNGGDGGDISLGGGDISFGDNSLVISSSSSDSGKAGNGGQISLSGGDISFGDNSGVYSESFSIFGNGGDGGQISLSGGDIFFGDDSRVYSVSYSFFDGNAGNGGQISLSGGDISIGDNSGVDSESFSNYGNGGDGGQLSLWGGAIIFGVDTSVYSDYYSSFDGNAGYGGQISLSGGDISFGDNSGVYSFSYSDSGNAANGGEISLIARDGDIIGTSANLLLSSFALSENKTAGNGGNVTLEAGNAITNLEILTLSSSNQAGTVEIRGLGDLSVTNTRILTSKQVEVLLFFRTIILDVGGEGQSGDVTVTSLGNLTFNNSSIESDTNGSDRAGEVKITSPGQVTFNNSQIISNTSNIGNAGNIFINAGGGITFQGLYSYQDTPQRGGLFAGTTNSGNAGTITLTTPELTLENGANIATTTESSGKAGNITLQSHPNQENLTINLAQDTSISASTNSPFTQATGGDIKIKAPDAITIQGEGTITTSTTGTGNAGTITLDTSTLTIARGAEIFAFTNGSGDSGTITVNATTAVNLGLGVDDFSPVLSVETRDTGKAGNIIVNTPSLTLSDTARITATATNTAMNPEGGGSISLNASTMNLAGIVGVFADTQGQTPAGTLTLKPYQTQSTLDITLAPQSRISASTSGSGRGGNLEVSAPEAITIRGAGTLAVETTGEGAAGNLTIDTQRLTIADGATISASTASANPDGFGGNITINATESFTLNQAQLSAQSIGAAQAGNITINTGQLTATNGTIATSTEQSAGGAITITASDIRLFGDSDITSRVASGAGGGGNITLTADTILAFDDSDILAFARDGRGGDITFNTVAFFGENFKPAPKGTDPDTLEQNERVDINATGAVEGVITLPDTSFVENSFILLSGNGIDTDELIAESCIARRHEPQRGSFFITGTGGIPFRPGDLYDTPYQTGTVRTIPSVGDGEAWGAGGAERAEGAGGAEGAEGAGGESSSSTRRPWKMGDPIIEPTGIYRLANGKVIMSRLCGE
ncbi:MAG: filamentous hemagglutinin N-terminal domain-containing protein [Coleofasciculus sp. G3-WIS-01]|uniref:two-partner secretion domain-containing protein n=1 Tax=Coleofasciculus sp. G3-WIS-01 TaxID=3069528 RepID=UPI0032F98C75